MFDVQNVIFMKCPYPDELCDSVATLSDLEFPIDDGWMAVLHCASGHRFIIGQKVGPDPMEDFDE